MALYLGIDGGGVKTTAIVANESGKVLAKTVGASIDYKTIGITTARKNLKAIIAELSEKTGENKFKCACIGSSAISSKRRRLWFQILSKQTISSWTAVFLPQWNVCLITVLVLL